MSGFATNLIDKYNLYELIDKEIISIYDEHYEICIKNNISKKEIESEIKHRLALELLDKVLNDYLIFKFFDIESYEMLDLKLEVLSKLVKGKTIEDIGDDYYKILELYPKDKVLEDGTIEHIDWD